MEGKVCEQSRASENLAIHHPYSILLSRQHYDIISYELLKKIHDWECDTEQVQIQICPKCHTHRPSDLKARKMK
jgi:hypothetical protein